MMTFDFDVMTKVINQKMANSNNLREKKEIQKDRRKGENLDS